MFSGKQLIKLILPLVVEQFLAMTIGIADTLMVSNLLGKRQYPVFLWLIPSISC